MKNEDVDLEKLARFIARAKKHTYADDQARAIELKDGFKELAFDPSGSGFRYRDRYAGSNPFSGEETVFVRRTHEEWKPLWIMNYYGGTTKEFEELSRTSGGILTAKVVYSSLRRALREITIEEPFRGPNKLIDGDFEYLHELEEGSDLLRFRGREKINFVPTRQTIYLLEHHGGLIRS